MPSAAAEQPIDLQAALHKLGVRNAAWYVLLDAAQGPEALDAARLAGMGATSLYSGDFGRRLDEVAPHLAAFDPASTFADWLRHHWQESLGILLQSSAPFEEVRIHCKRFLMVKSPDGRTLRFRYYDPRVLRAFLPVCSSSELASFFGPVACFLAAGRPGPSLLAFTVNRQKLLVRDLRLLPPALETPTASPVVRDLQIIVLDAVRGTPIEGAAVVVEGMERRSAVTGTGGRITFDELPAGSYNVYGIDGELRQGRCSVDLSRNREPVFLMCRK